MTVPKTSAVEFAKPQRTLFSGTVTEHSEFPKVGALFGICGNIFYLRQDTRKILTIYVRSSELLPDQTTEMNWVNEQQQALEELQILPSFSLHRPSATNGQILHVASGPRALDLPPPQRYQRRAGTSQNKPSGPAAESSQNHLPDCVIVTGEMFVLSIPPGPEHWEESEQTFEAIH